MLLETNQMLELFLPPGRGPCRAKRGWRKDEPDGGQEQGRRHDADLAAAVQFQYGFVEFGFDEKPDTLRAVQESGDGADTSPEPACVTGIVQPDAACDVQ